MLADSWSSDNACWPTDGHQISDIDPQLVNRQQMMSHSCLSDKEWCPIACPQMINDVTKLVIRWGMIFHNWLSDEGRRHTADHQIRNDVLQLVMRWGMIYVSQLVICQWHSATDDNPIMNDNPQFVTRYWIELNIESHQNATDGQKINFFLRRNDDPTDPLPPL